MYELLLVGRDALHVEHLRNAFPEAFVITPFSMLAGRQFKKIVLVGLEFTETEKDRFDEWYKSVLAVRLTRDNGGIHFV